MGKEKNQNSMQFPILTTCGVSQKALDPGAEWGVHPQTLVSRFFQVPWYLISTNRNHTVSLPAVQVCEDGVVDVVDGIITICTIGEQKGVKGEWNVDEVLD